MKIKQKLKHMFLGGSLGFGEGFYLTCSNNECLKIGNSKELMTALLVALALGSIGAIGAYFFFKFIEEIVVDNNTNYSTHYNPYETMYVNSRTEHTATLDEGYDPDYSYSNLEISNSQ